MSQVDIKILELAESMVRLQKAGGSIPEHLDRFIETYIIVSSYRLLGESRHV